MLLASFDVLGPVAGPCALVVEQAAYAQLLGGGAVPAGPVPGAGGLMAEDTVQPVAMVGLDRRVRLAFTVAVVRPPGIIAALGDAAMFAGEHETVRTVEELGTTVHAFPVAIAIVDVAHHSRLRLARILLLLFLSQRAYKRGTVSVPPSSRPHCDPHSHVLVAFMTLLLVQRLSSRNSRRILMRMLLITIRPLSFAFVFWIRRETLSRKLECSGN